ncbi:death domain-containing membrane protein NRADD-like [Perognathus longimembris pacificus]|uniref:death domain-containing membrane protein NRADD-like n=1 Tax=Perognathus longimembris pacificus TaxID=214514 RepID=UPI002019B3F0|nr:death domain-containing membrane protein NRADD-like [Perognathus longimembris pacificus]
MEKEAWVGAGGALSPNTSSPSPPEPPGTSGSVIPVYCALLATVILGLLAYVVFKCWRSRKQRQQLAKVRTAELGALDRDPRPAEDGGVEPGGHAQGRQADPDGPLYLHLPRKQQEAVARLLEAPSEPPQGWRALAGLLGCGAEAVEAAARSGEPASTLLGSWASQEGARATLGELRAALAALGREDVLRALDPPAEARSAL